MIEALSTILNRLHRRSELRPVIHRLINDVVGKLATNFPTEVPVFGHVRSVRATEVTEQSLDSLVSEITDLLVRVSLINERYIVSSLAVHEIKAFLDRRKIAVVIEKQSSGSVGPLYAAVEPSTQFKKDLVDSLPGLRGKLYAPAVFNKHIDAIVSRALGKLKSEQFKFVSPQNLPPEVRAPEARDADRYKWEGFERDLKTNFKRYCLVDGNKVQEIQRVVNGISYIPRPLIEFVE